MQSKSIVVLSDHFPPEFSGGAEKIALYSAQALAARGWKVAVISFNHTADQLYRIEGIPVRSVYRRAYPFYWRAYRNLLSFDSAKVLRLIAEERPDLILLHNAHQYVTFGLWYALRKRYPTSMVLHDAVHLAMSKIEPTDAHDPDSQIRPIRHIDLLKKYTYLYNPIYFAAAKRLLRSTNLVAVSNALAKLYRANGITNVTVVPNGLPDEVLSGTPFPELAGSKFFLHIGRLSRHKGTVQAIRAHEELAKRYPGVKLVLAGDRKAAEEFRAQSAYPADVHAVGWVPVEQAAWLYRNAIAALTLSVYLDPFPTTNLEACLHGCPIIGTCFGGTPEVVREGENGRIVNPHNVGMIVAAMEELLVQPEKRKRFSQEARRLFESQYTLERYGERLEQAMLSPTDRA